MATAIRFNISTSSTPSDALTALCEALVALAVPFESIQLFVGEDIEPALRCAALVGNENIQQVSPVLTREMFVRGWDKGQLLSADVMLYDVIGTADERPDFEGRVASAPGHLAIFAPWPIAQGFERDFSDAATENALATRTREEECLLFDCYRERGSSTFFLVEVFNSVMAFEHHLGTDHYRKFASVARPIFVGDRGATIRGRLITWSEGDPEK